MITRELPLLLLVSLSPFVSFYVHNLSQRIALSDLWTYPAATFAIASASFLTLRSTPRVPSVLASSLVAVFVIVTFNFETTSRLFGDYHFGATGQKIGWLVLLSTALALTAWLGARAGFHQFLLVFAAVNLMLPLPSLILYDRSAHDTPAALDTYRLESNPIWSGEAIRTPNIYWVVADSYPNERQLQEFFGFDNSEFVAGLRARDFFVADEAYAHYSSTILSVPSTLQMEMAFPNGEPFLEVRNGVPTLLTGGTTRGLLEAIAGDNRTVAYLKQLGYRYVHFDGGASTKTACRGYEDACLHARRTAFTELESSLLKLVPWTLVRSVMLRLPDLSTSVAVVSGTSIPEFAEGLSGVSDGRSPLFVYAHFMTPHDPYNNDAECNVFPRGQARSRADGPDAFLDQLRCVNRHLGALLDTLETRDPSAIVILSSDHGPRHSTPAEKILEDLAPAEVRENLGILNAIRVPKPCRSDLHSRISPINVMRLVFACLGGHPPKFVEPRFYVDRPYTSSEYGLLRRVAVFE